MNPPERLAFGDFVLDRSQRLLLRRDGSMVALTPRLYNALLLFLESAGRLVEKDTLMRALWPRVVVEENNLSQLISGLRLALGDDPKDSRYLVTVPRVGFRFVAAVHALAAPAMLAAKALPAQEAPSATVLRSPSATRLQVIGAATMPGPRVPPEAPAAQQTRRWLIGSGVAAAAGVAATA